ncbi:MAG TPA: rod shape-determining protein MreC [Bacteroidales bacterium]|nr:rod shape-determining protein MreC [Bacteroidales bacterium]HOU96243.1 rod shape-determining protein MreC [Bacteroidales bacterium]HQG36830.1 rod shape-determining protein MreC [Bacteroidales bacterium]HQG53058.1 rod shape-determining protein MreC [Bacteroidales bacterium]
MKSLLQFLTKHNRLIIFILLEGVAFYLIFTSNNYHNTQLVKGIRSSTLAWESIIKNMTNYFRIKKLNAELQTENRELRNTLEKMISVRKDSILSVILITTEEPQYEFIAAEVVNNSVNRQKNFFTLNVGTKQGADVNMGVISPSGAAGIIISAGKNYSVAISLLNLDFRLSAKIKSNDYFGSLSWDGSNYRYAILNDIPQHVLLNKGDTVVTTGYSAIFPAGIMVGTISDFEKSGSEFYSIKVKLATDFKKLAHVYLIKNNRRQEQISIEKEYND